MSQQMRDAFIASKGSTDQAIPIVTNKPYEPSSGHDSTARSVGGSGSISGIPHKPRHRKYFGLETRPGTIRL